MTNEKKQFLLIFSDEISAKPILTELNKTKDLIFDDLSYLEVYF